MLIARVLSLQSHVVSGCVGNRAYVFPQQVLGFDVDFINSVQFSNHTGYPVVKGSVMDGSELEDLCGALQSNGLIDYDYLATGYIGSETFLLKVVELLDCIIRANPRAKFVCDPVLGDDGKYYVPETLVKVFRESVVPKSYMITPNQFEAELLTESKILNHEDCLRVLNDLHLMGPSVVVITSVEYAEELGVLSVYCLDKSAPSAPGVVTRIVIEKIPGHFTGTGDAMASLLLAWVHRLGPGQAGLALRFALSTMQGILSTTTSIQNARRLLVAPDLLDSPAVNARLSELCIIQSKSVIESPPELIGSFNSHELF